MHVTCAADEISKILLSTPLVQWPPWMARPVRAHTYTWLREVGRGHGPVHGAIGMRDSPRPLEKALASRSPLFSYLVLPSLYKTHRLWRTPHSLALYNF